MTAQYGFSEVSVPSAGTKSRVSVCETNWGYIIRSDTQLRDRAVLIERVSGIAGLTFLAIAAGNWLIPQVQAAGLMSAPQQMLTTVGLAVSGLIFLWISERGMTREVQVDVRQRRLRIAQCNRRGRARVEQGFAFDDISSAYVTRSEGGTKGARLFLRLSESARAVPVASGREPTMRVLHERLSHEIRAVPIKVRGWERVGRKLQPIARGRGAS